MPIAGQQPQRVHACGEAAAPVAPLAGGPAAQVPVASLRRGMDSGGWAQAWRPALTGVSACARQVWRPAGRNDPRHMHGSGWRKVAGAHAQAGRPAAEVPVASPRCGVGPGGRAQTWRPALAMSPFVCQTVLWHVLPACLPACLTQAMACGTTRVEQALLCELVPSTCATRYCASASGVQC